MAGGGSQWEGPCLKALGNGGRGEGERHVDAWPGFQLGLLCLGKDTTCMPDTVAASGRVGCSYANFILALNMVGTFVSTSTSLKPHVWNPQPVRCHPFHNDNQLSEYKQQNFATHRGIHRYRLGY